MKRSHRVILYAGVIFGYFLGCNELSSANAPVSLTRIRTGDGISYLGEVRSETDEYINFFDLNAATTVSLSAADVQERTDEISEQIALQHIPLATYVSWKLSKIINTGYIEGHIARVSGTKAYMGLGSANGIKVGQPVNYLSDPLTITDPETGERLGVIRDQIASGSVTRVLGEHLSEISIDEKWSMEARPGMAVGVERGAVRVAVVKPKWESEYEIKTGNEALFLHVQLLAELTKYGYPVVSRPQIDQAANELALLQGVEPSAVSPVEIAQRVDATILLTTQILAQGTAGAVQIQVSDVESATYAGIISGKISREAIQGEAKRSRNFAIAKLNRQREQRFGSNATQHAVALKALLDRASDVKFNSDGLLDRLKIQGASLSAMEIALIASQRTLTSLSISRSNLKDEDFDLLVKLQGLDQLILYGNKSLTPGVAAVIGAGLPRLRWLDLNGTSVVNGETLPVICQLRNLETLNILGSRIGNDDLTVIARLPKIDRLNVAATEIDDDGLSLLKGIATLRRLDIRRTKITARGVEGFKKARPECDVIFE